MTASIRIERALSYVRTSARAHAAKDVDIGTQEAGLRDHPPRRDHCGRRAGRAKLYRPIVIRNQKLGVRDKR